MPPPPPPPTSSLDPPEVRRTNLWITLGILAIAVVAGAWWLLRPPGVDLAVDGTPIGNAAEILAAAEAQFGAIVEADDSTTTDETSCWFAPEGEDRPGPQVVCGPVLLGISPADQPWLVGQVSWGFPSDGRVAGEFSRFDGTTTAMPAALRRPDGRRLGEVPALEPPSTGLRAPNGARIIDADEALRTAEEAVRTTALDTGAAVGDDLRCWFAIEEQGPRRLIDGDLWCTPVLTVQSVVEEPWVQARVSSTPGEVLSTASLRPSVGSSIGTTALPVDVILWHPDGTAPPPSSDLELPDAAPVEPDTAAVVAVPLGEVATSPPRDGVLRTPSLSWTITGVGVTDRIGRGPEAIIAPVGHELVVAGSNFGPLDPVGFLRPGTATLVVGGVRIAFDDWARLDEDATGVVVVVPQGAGEVLVEVLADDIAQQISLRTGDKLPGFPTGIYREQAAVGVGASLRAELDLPAGEPAAVRSVVTELLLAGHDATLGWPRDEVFVRVEYADQDITRPCCDLDDLAIEVAPVLRIPGGDWIAPARHDSREATFVVPADTKAVELGTRLVGTWSGGTGSRRAQALSEPIRVTLP